VGCRTAEKPQSNAGEDESVTEFPKQIDLNMARRPVPEDVSVVIPTLGRPILETCLYYLAQGTLWPAEIIVVDQGRQRAVAELLDSLQALGLATNYVPSSQKGRAAAINRGLEQVGTRYVTITDDDCFVAADWIAGMTTRLRKNPDQILTGRVELAGSTEAAFSTVTSREPRLYTRPTLKSHPFIGGNVGMAMTLVDRIGYFDEHPCLGSAEDNDYGYRALRLGIPIAYDPEIVVFHYHWRDAGERASRYAEYAYSQGGFYGTHLRSGDRLILLQTARALVRSPVRWLRGLAQGDEEMAANGRAHTLKLLPGIVAGWRRNDMRRAV
jgi:GT2 family glycosyltransferase